MELDGWDTSRGECERLDELRRTAEELGIEAELRAGRAREVVARAQALVAQAPLRERRWSLLALAQYQAGRQSEARHLQWQLFVADAVSGAVEQIADLGRCTEPVDADGRFARVCERKEPSLSWTPDGKSITVLADSTLTTYDPTGKELSSEPTDLMGPIVWMTPK